MRSLAARGRAAKATCDLYSEGVRGDCRPRSSGWARSTENGQAPDATSTLGGWAFAVGAHTKNQAAAWAFIKMAEEPQNLLTTALWSGCVPPDTTVGQMPEFVNYAPPFQAAFNDYEQFGQPLPTDQNFPVYARALNTATGMFAQHPNTTVSQALAALKSGVATQLGSSSVESKSG